MQLKKDPENNTPKDKPTLYDYDFFDEKTDKDNMANPSESKYSSEYSRSGTNTGYADNGISDWDEKIEKNSFRITEEKAREALAPTRKQEKQRDERLLRVTEFILYIMYGLLIAVIAGICLNPRIDIMFKMRPLYVILGIVIFYSIFDAVLVYNIEEKHLSLFFVAIILNFFYPAFRQKYTPAKFGIICTLLTLFAYMMLGVNLGQANRTYGNVLQIKDTATRHTVAELMDQDNDQGHPLGPYLRRTLEIDDAVIESETRKTILTIHARGNLTLESIPSKNPDYVDTTLEFTRETGSGAFVITNAYLDGVHLSEKELSQYWTVLQK